MINMTEILRKKFNIRCNLGGADEVINDSKDDV